MVATEVVNEWHGVPVELDLDACRERLVRLALEDGAKVAEIAQSAGVSRMTLWRFLRGQKVSPRTVSRVLKALGLELDRVARIGQAAAAGAAVGVAVDAAIQVAQAVTAA